MTTSSSSEVAVRALYQDVTDAWNLRSGAAYARYFTEDGIVVGFDGSQMEGRAGIQQTLDTIFERHSDTHRQVSIIREVRVPTPDVALLRSIAGFIAPGESDIDPDLNCVLVLVAVRQNDEWLIANFQNTPLQLHAGPEARDAVSRELRAAL
jgi:uncharacterized protein (TIGR02246 family)